MSGGAEIRVCACVSPFQDKKYGKKKRVHNKSAGLTDSKFRCTVCGNIQSGGTPKAKKGK